MFLGHTEELCFRVKAFPSPPGWNASALPVLSMVCLFSNSHLLAWFELFAFMFGSLSNGEVRLVCLICLFLSYLHRAWHLFLFPYFLDILNYKVLLDKKKYPTLSSFGKYELFLYASFSFSKRWEILVL